MSDRELPPNWRSAKDSDGKEYYFNELTGDTSWSFPEGGEKKAAPVTPTVAHDDMEFAPSVEPGMVSVDNTPNPVSYGKRAVGGANGVSSLLGDGMLLRVLLLLFCSLVVLISSAIELGRASERVLIGELAVLKSNGSTEAYGVAVGSVSLGFGIIFLALAKYKPDTFSNWTSKKGDLTITQCFTIFLALWWTPAAAVLTFFNPFRDTSNAYFAVWAAFILSLLLLSASFSRVNARFSSMMSVREYKSRTKWLVGLAVASCIVLFAAIETVGQGNGASTFGLIAGIFSAALSALVFYLVDRNKLGAKGVKAFALFFVALWIAAAIVLTFGGPFSRTGNGYFATWAATFCAVCLLYEELVGGEVTAVSAVRRSFSFRPMIEPTETPAGMPSVSQTGSVA